MLPSLSVYLSACLSLPDQPRSEVSRVPIRSSPTVSNGSNMVSLDTCASKQNCCMAEGCWWIAAQIIGPRTAHVHVHPPNPLFKIHRDTHTIKWETPPKYTYTPKYIHVHDQRDDRGSRKYTDSRPKGDQSTPISPGPRPGLPLVPACLHLGSARNSRRTHGWNTKEEHHPSQASKRGMRTQRQQSLPPNCRRVNPQAHPGMCKCKYIMYPHTDLSKPCPIAHNPAAEGPPRASGTLAPQPSPCPSLYGTHRTALGRELS
jgi:hypothetical protein